MYSMGTKAIKKQAAFRFDGNLLDSVYNVPNQTTLDAMKEAEEGKSAGIADTSSLEAFLKSCE
jgi:hypothetical protein